MINTPVEERDTASLGALAVCSTAAASDESRRFAYDFQDPDYTIKVVPYARLKRLFDIAFSFTFLLLGWPVLLLLAIGVRLTSRGPVMFKQVRVGRGGRHFYCYKFRSMCVDAEKRKEELKHLNEATGPVFKIKEDPRVTRFGQFMRKLSLDELPQFYNALIGDMSVVGPRPPLPCEVVEYTDHERRRLSVLPGITCLWQIKGRSNLSFEKWVELDLEYIDAMSFGYDLKIILQTIPAVFTGHGAH